jgi:outer membrane protein assembly factor BamA
MRLYFLSFPFLLLQSLLSHTQEYRLTYSYIDNWKNKSLPDSVFKNKDLANKYLVDLQNNLIEKGYFLFSIESLEESILGKRVKLYSGPVFQEAKLDLDSVEKVFLQRNGFSQGSLKLTQIALRNYLKSISDIYLNNGYPFAKLLINESEFETSTKFNGKLSIIRGEKYTWGNIIIKGDSSVLPSLIYNLSGIKFGKMYNESLLREMDKEISFLPYIEQFRKPELLFYDRKVDVYLYLKSRPVSSINGALGLQPNPATQRMAFTGQIQLKLQNVLKRAELFEMNWRSIQPGTQNLFIQSNVPYLFKTRFGLDSKFNLYKRDSSFLEVKSTVGLTYSLRNNFTLKGFYSFWSNSSLNSNSAIFNYTSTVLNSYGVSVNRRNVDYAPNPRKGSTIFAELALGNRKVRTIEKPELSAKGQLTIEKFFPLVKRHVIKIAVNWDWIFNDTTYANERIRFGGLNSLRGFNEEELFATSYFISQLEYRFLLDRNSALLAFYNQAWYEDNSELKYVKDSPLGFGFGLTFGTKLGIFSVTYALGRQFSNSIQLNQGKIHIGYISFF